VRERNPGQACGQTDGLTLIAAWCIKQGIPLGIEQVLDPDTVERFCSRGLKKTPSRGSYRATLRRLGRELTTKAPWEPRPEPMPARKVSVRGSEVVLHGGGPTEARDHRTTRDSVACTRTRTLPTHPRLLPGILESRR
jgi:hypothetical protein